MDRSFLSAVFFLYCHFPPDVTTSDRESGGLRRSTTGTVMFPHLNFYFDRRILFFTCQSLSTEPLQLQPCRLFPDTAQICERSVKGHNRNTHGKTPCMHVFKCFFKDFFYMDHF